MCRETPDLGLKYACSIVRRLHSAYIVISLLVSPIKSKQLCLCTSHLQVISSCIHLARTPHRGKVFSCTQWLKALVLNGKLLRRFTDFCCDREEIGCEETHHFSSQVSHIFQWGRFEFTSILRVHKTALKVCAWKIFLSNVPPRLCKPKCDSRGLCALRIVTILEKRAKDREQMAVNLLLLDRDLSYQTGGHPTRWGRISSPAAEFILSAVQMVSNRLMVPLSGLKYEAFGGRETKLTEKFVLFWKFITKNSIILAWRLRWPTETLPNDLNQVSQTTWSCSSGLISSNPQQWHFQLSYSNTGSNNTSVKHYCLKTDAKTIKFEMYWVFRYNLSL